ncbi:MAG: GNAT family N-acetyltransferase [Janthinobacterium lividum]
MSADLQPTLTGGLVALRPVAAADWDALYAVASDPLIWAVHPVNDRWQEPVFRRFFDDAIAGGGGLVATDVTSGEIIGFSRYDLARVEPGEVEIGWTFLARSYWGGAANADMKRLMIGHALRQFDRALFLVGETNIRSRRAMEKIGGRLTDRIYDADYPSGVVRHVIYAIDRKGFAAGPLA